ncbi:MAG: hypothetical protein RXP86_09005 [Acidilobus sp.]|jgi:hypothetical protein
MAEEVDDEVMFVTDKKSGKKYEIDKIFFISQDGCVLVVRTVEDEVKRVELCP